MKALLLDQPGKLLLTVRPEPPAPGPDEVLLRVRKIGVCGTDLHAYEGNQPFFSYPRILGHELGVEVQKVGARVTHVKPGDLCTVEPYKNETDDQAVRRGKTNCGENLKVFGVHEDGGMQERFVYPAKYLHPSSLLTLEQLALVEPMTVGCHAVNRAEVGPEDTVLVIGTGPIGIGTIQFAQAAGAQVVAMDLNQERLDFCQKTLRVKGIVNPREGDTEAQIRTHLNGDLPTVVFDATGNSTSMMKAFEFVAYGGKLVYIGLFKGDITFHDPYFHKKEISLLASRNALSQEFKQVIEYLETKKVDVRPWITHRCQFDEVPNEFPLWVSGKEFMIKAVISLD